MWLFNGAQRIALMHQQITFRPHLSMVMIYTCRAAIWLFCARGIATIVVIGG